MTTLANKLQNVLDGALRRQDVPGATAAVYLGGDRLFLGASGFSDLGEAQRLDAQVIFPSFSITKTLTAVSALRLAERGGLVLDEPLARWLPELPWSRRVSLRQILGHTAGIPNYSAMPSQLQALHDHPLLAWSFEQFVEATCFQGLAFAPGEGWAYSNTGYMLMKRVLELCTGSSFAAVTREHVVEPLGLEHTFALDTLDSMRGLTPGFSERFAEAGKPEDVHESYDPGWCATGVLASTADEVCRIFEGLFAGRLLRADSLREMFALTPVPGIVGSASPSYGLGIMADPGAPYGPEFGHGGGGPGYDLRVSHFPALAGRPVTLSALCNRDRDEASWQIVRALRDAVAAEPQPVRRGTS